MALSSRLRSLAALSLAACAGTALAAPDNFPSRPIRLIVAYPSGGISDTVARALGEKLSAQLGTSVVVENRGGAGGSIGIDAVAKAPADGYTLGFSSTSPLTLTPHVSHVNYDPKHDIAPVMSVMYSPVLVVATHSFQGKTFQDLLAQAKAKPGSVRWATSGQGTIGHVMLEQIKAKTRTDLIMVPYKGAGQQLNDALGGQFEVMSTNASPMLTQHMQAGRLRPLAVGAPKRLESLPAVPTFAELGIPRANLTSTFGIFAPAKTPPAILARLNTELNKALAEPDVRDRLLKGGVVPTGGSAAQFAAAIRGEYEDNARIVREAGIKED
ncbi:ABC transporter substrate-binding protein [Cupriavidus sp. USMAA2-4]|uniref:ABC transporter substrate-binding protein n=1 Tax=Cupriavidus malaysiensis TaxID=367825 RepID=A0ABM6F0F3_9BURK|nr:MULTISPECIES: tripartite tricarboxylate transporter substrate binding protein [Cupriavidus]AOY92105.1 ABC transporter substrate-binding protein [Cupriavidus sp. USMAA2-4]AOY98336.1 ABC transporter substrate-binding protein [Cupriavidus sp. USMAHM13]AOZ04767.1 ABC transporter substrate-binding protein [Cupriavidus malaysiensis]